MKLWYNKHFERLKIQDGVRPAAILNIGKAPHIGNVSTDCHKISHGDDAEWPSLPYQALKI